MATKFTHITLKEDKELVVSNKKMLCSQLRALGIQKGMTILVQANMKKLGYIIGDEQIVIEALMDVVGYEGTIIVPTFTYNLLDPACQADSIDRKYWRDIRQYSLAYDKKRSAPSSDDTLACQFLRNEGVLRSSHPLYSFAAWGKYAKFICNEHPLHYGLNEDSPLGKLCELNGSIVLLGCDYADCVLYKLASYKLVQAPIKVISAPIQTATTFEWKHMLDIAFDHIIYPDMKVLLEEHGLISIGEIGSCEATMFAAKDAVDLAQVYQHVKEETKTSQN